MLDTGLWRSSGAAVMAADQNDVSMAFGHARRNGSDADFGDELYANTRDDWRS